MGLFSAFRNNRELVERLEKLERQMRSSELDWDELYQKCRKLLGRVAKERANMERVADDEPENGQPTATTSDTGRLSGLSLRQREIQQNILRRRAGIS